MTDYQIYLYPDAQEDMQATDDMWQAKQQEEQQQIEDEQEYGLPF